MESDKPVNNTGMAPNTYLQPGQRGSVIDFEDKDSIGKDDELAVNLEAEEKITPFVVFLTVSGIFVNRVYGVKVCK